MTPDMPEDIRKEINEKGGVESILSHLPDDKEMERCARIHSALGDKKRLKILCFLYHQRSCVCLLHDITGLSYSRLSYHLSVLKKAELVDSEKTGNFIIYDLTPLGRKYLRRLCEDTQ